MQMREEKNLYRLKLVHLFPKLTATFNSLGKALVWTLLIFEEIRSILTKLIFRSTEFVHLSIYKYTKRF